ncbi:MAG: O-antigen ligase family protein, partial [Candidatus Omnitrophica bacterium]|nr:O-antigen ligase family protein [Candidatus Omnitrophota bacterium]
MNRTIKILDFIIYWSIILIPFYIAIAPAPASIFMGFLLAAFILKKALKKEFFFLKTSVNWPLLLLFMITCISLFNSINYLDTFRGGIGRMAHFILVLFALAEEVKDRKHATKIIVSMLFGVTLVSVDAIWQVAFGADFIRGYEPVINIGLVRATASFKDSNTFGIFLSAIAPLAFGLTLYYFKGRRRLLLAIPSFLIFLGILLTYSRPTLLAIYLILLFFALVRKDKILIFCLVIVALLSPLLLPKSVKQWAKEVEYNPVRFMCNDDRIAAYRNSMNMIKAHPLIGVGANTYMKNYKKYKESPEYRNVVTQDTMYAHNMYLQMAAEIGLIGFGIFIWL